jgi:hypothetical protein
MYKSSKEWSNNEINGSEFMCSSFLGELLCFKVFFEDGAKTDRIILNNTLKEAAKL